MDMDVGSAIQEARNDARASYTLGFNPQNWDGKYHKVRVSCTRRGVHVLAPDGYYAFEAASLDEEESSIQAATWSPFDAGEIGVRATVSPSEKIPQAVRLSIRINADDVQMARSESGYSGHVSVTLIAYETGGKQSMLKQTGYPFHMNAEQRQGAIKNGIRLSIDQPLAEDVGKIRIIVFDRSSNAVGSLTVPVTSADRNPSKSLVPRW